MVEFGKLNKALKLPTNPKELLEGLPFNIGEQWSGKTIRNKDMYVEFGGPRVKAAAELIEFNEEDKNLEDGKIELWGPDIDEIDEGASYSFIETIMLSGLNLDKITPAILEGIISHFHDFIEGVMHLNMRNLIWIRIHKSIAKKGIRIEHLARALMGQLKANFPQIEKIEIKFLIDSAQNPNKTLRILKDDCFYIWEQRNIEALELNDDEVDKFYGCTGCKYYCPNHACIITPNNYGTCGVINWKDADISYKLSPKQYFFEIPKGDILNNLYGSYSGINQKISKFTSKTVERINLYSAIKDPQTSCRYFEALIFQIPEVDALGIADYYYKGETPLEINFSTVNKIYNRTNQSPGYRGIALTTFRDKKFMQGDGGWKRIVWMNKNLKERIAKWIPDELKDKIATEENALSAKKLIEFIDTQDHPLKKEYWNGTTWNLK